MALPSDPRREKVILVGLLLATPIGLFIGPAVDSVVGFPLLTLTVLFGALGVGLWQIRRFPRLIIAGILGGALTGGLVLGGGLRLAMRVVAITDPATEPEFTVEGTLFIVLGFAVLGAGAGMVISLLLRGWRLRRVYVALATGALGMALLLASSDLRSELLDLGRGPLLNIPMFFTAFFLFGLAVTPTVRWLQARLPMTPGRSLGGLPHSGTAGEPTAVGS